MQQNREKGISKIQQNQLLVAQAQRQNNFIVR